MCDNNEKIKQYQNLLFWRNLFVFGSPIVMIVGSLLLDLYGFLVFWPYAYITGFIFLSKNTCPYCDDPFFLYRKESLGSTLDLFPLFRNHCVNCGEPKNKNTD